MFIVKTGRRKEMDESCLHPFLYVYINTHTRADTLSSSFSSSAVYLLRARDRRISPLLQSYGKYNNKKGNANAYPVALHIYEGYRHIRYSGCEYRAIDIHL